MAAIVAATWLGKNIGVPLLVNWGIGRLFRPRGYTYYELDSLEGKVPLTETGTPIPVVFGTVWIAEPHVLWFGDLSVTPIDIEPPYNWLAPGTPWTPPVTTGYRYAAGVHFGLCQTSIDSIREIRANDAVLYDTPVTTNTQIEIDEPSAFGGDHEGGGVEGFVDLEFGGPAQSQNDYLATHQTVNIGAYRGIVGVVLRQVYIAANTAHFYPWTFKVRAQYGSAIGDDDVNPAAVIEELLTDTTWGLGLPSADLDEPSFAAAKATLATEEFGFSWLWNQGTKQQLIEHILSAIDGVLFLDPHSGEIRLKLIRDDFNESDLPILDESNLVEVSSYTRPSLSELHNTIIAKWVSRDGEDQSATIHNAGMLAQQGYRIISREVEYPGIRDPDLIQAIAARDLRYLSTPLSALVAVGNRELAQLTIGDPFIFQWQRYGANEVMRVTHIDYGTLTDGRVQIHAMQDIYADAGAIYDATPATEWFTPINEPQVPDHRYVFEESHYMIAHRLGTMAAPVWFQYDDTAGWKLLVASKPTADHMDYDMWRLYPAPYYTHWINTGTHNFCPHGVLQEDITREITTTTTLAQTSLLGYVQEGTYCLIGDEVCEVTAVNADTVTLTRGVMDTTVTEHSTGDVVYFAEGFTAGLGLSDPLLAGATIQSRVLTRTLKGAMDLDDAPIDSLVLDGRYIRPYPPGNYEINSERWPEYITGEMTATWAHRNRLAQTGLVGATYGLVAQDTGDIGPELGTTYTVVIYDENDAIARTETSISGTTCTYDMGDEIADLGIGRPNETMRVVVYSVRDGYNSWQDQDFVIAECRGYGMFYGAYYGE